MFFNVLLKSRNKPSNDIKPRIKEHEHQTDREKKKNEHHQIKEYQQEQTQENPHKTTPKPNHPKNRNPAIQRIETQQSTQLIHSQTKP